MKEDSFNGILITMVVVGLSLGLTYYIPFWQAQDMHTFHKGDKFSLNPNLMKPNVSTLHISTIAEELTQLNSLHLPVEIIQNGVKGKCFGFSAFSNNSTIYCSEFYGEFNVTVLDVSNAKICYTWNHGSNSFCQ